MCPREKQIPYKSRYIELRNDENFNLEYLKLTPNGVVPTLVHDGKPAPERRRRRTRLSTGGFTRDGMGASLEKCTHCMDRMMARPAVAWVYSSDTEEVPGRPPGKSVPGITADIFVR